MKTWIFLFYFIALTVTMAHAGSFVLYETASGKVVDISPIDDAVVQEGQKKVYLESEVVTVKPVDFYKVSAGKVVFDAVSFNASEIQKAQYETESKIVAEENALIEAKMREIAYDALVAEGVIFKKVQKEDLSK